MTIVAQNGPTQLQTPDTFAAADGSFWAKLHASRRIDWRFLLPDPRLQNVAYIGPAKGAIYESLARFSEKLAVISQAGDETDANDAYNVVVCSAECGPAVSRGIRLVRPGGFLYVELDRRLRRCRWRRAHSLPNGQFSETTAGDVPRTAEECVRLLNQSGFEQTISHWHWPDFDSCLEMVRLDDRAALLHVMSRRGSGPSARLKAALGRALIRTGLFPRMARCVSVLAQRPSQ